MARASTRNAVDDAVFFERRRVGIELVEIDFVLPGVRYDREFTVGSESNEVRIGLVLFARYYACSSLVIDYLGLRSDCSIGGEWEYSYVGSPRLRCYKTLARWVNGEMGASAFA